jgi:hypothetical protein
MTQFPTHSYFGNSVKEFHPHETLSTAIKLSLSLFINIVLFQHI